MEERDGKNKVCNLVVEGLADDSEKVARLQVQVTAQDAQLTSIALASWLSGRALEAMTLLYMSVVSDCSALHAAGEGREGLFQDIVERVCTEHGALMHTNATSYHNRINGLLS